VVDRFGKNRHVAKTYEYSPYWYFEGSAESIHYDFACRGKPCSRLIEKTLACIPIVPASVAIELRFQNLK